MSKLSTKICIITVLFSILVIGYVALFYEQPLKDISTVNEQSMHKSVEVKITTLDDLKALFEKLNYTDKDWKKGNREVPRITFEAVGERWQQSSKKLPVKVKKSIFFRLMAPLVLLSNEHVLKEREIVIEETLDSKRLKLIAIKYHVIKNVEQQLTEANRKELLIKVDIMPPSLVLAQAAEESGWGTSRFTVEGNAFFGQWDFSGEGMTPKKQRKALGDYGLARFDSPLASVEGYMLNINTTKAYEKLRQLRATLRKSKKDVTGLTLADTLDKYSERGQAYIDGIKSMIRYNKLQAVDEAYLSDNKIIHLIE